MIRFVSPTFWFGPLFRFELVRIARRGLHNPLRLAFAAALLATLVGVYSNWFPEADLLSLESEVVVEPSESARFAETFVFIVLMLQLVIVVVLTPFHVAASIVEERQKRTMEYLLASPLSSREIIFGKLGARLLFVLSLLLMVLPLLALMQFWGGIDMGNLIAGYVVIVFTMFALGGLTARYAVEMNSTGRAVFAVYAWFFGVGAVAFCCTMASHLFAIASPIAVLWMLFRDTRNEVVHFVPVLAMAYSAIGLAASLSAASHLRDTVNYQGRIDGLALSAANTEYHELFERLRTLVREMERPKESPESQVVQPLARDYYGKPTMPPAPTEPLNEDEPLLWKECNFPKGIDWAAQGGCAEFLFTSLIIGLVTGGIGMLMLALAGLSEDGETSGLFHFVVRWFGLLALYGMCIASGLRATLSVTRERQDQTLDSILMLPINRSSILAAKWLNALRRGPTIRLALVVLCGLGVISGGLSLLAVPLVAIYAVTFHLFCTTFGLWLSTVCSSTNRATISFVVVLLFLCVSPWVLDALSIFQTKGRAEIVESSISSTASWQAVAFSSQELTGERYSSLLHRLLGALVNVLALALASAVFWLHARRRFEREGR